MQEAISSRSQVRALLGIAAVVLFAGSSARSAPSTDKAVQPSAIGLSSPACPGPKCPDKSKHAHARRTNAIKVNIDPPEPDQKTVPPTNSTGGPTVNPGR